MIRFLAPVLGILMLVGVVGCQSDNKMSDSKMMSEVDVCPTCKGTQKATADGKCEMCGKMVADACPMCPGVQVAVDGKCPSCGKGVSK